MRVYFVSSNLQGCYAVRCLYPLMAGGWDGDQTTINQNYKTPENKVEASKNADVVVFHRPEYPDKLKIARLLKQAGKKIVYDNDDTYKDDGGFKFNEFMDKERLSRGMTKVSNQLDEFIKEADLVTCTTKFLAEEYKKINPNVVVLPNCVDPFYFDEPLKNNNGKVRIGIVGSLMATKDFDLLTPIIGHYINDPRVELVIFSLPPKDEDEINRKLYKEEYEYMDKIVKADNVEWQSFVMFEQYYEKLNELRLDMAIIPRAETYFNKCKSNLKFLEMSMLEIPVIAQGFEDGNSPYQDPEDAKHMVIVTDNSKWIHEIELLIENKELREEMGKKAKEYVISRYDIEKNIHLWEEAYQSLFINNENTKI